MSRANVRVRPAERGDVDALVDLVSSAETRSAGIGERRPADPGVAHLARRLGQIVDQPGRTVLVAADEQSGDLVGLLVAKLDEIGAIDITPALHITHLLVAPRHRRRGVGRTLLAAAVHVADEAGVDRVLATAASGSREANRYLARLGFAPLVVHRVASTAALRRSLGISDVSERIALLRRARLARPVRTAATDRHRRLVHRGA